MVLHTVLRARWGEEMAARFQDNDVTAGWEEILFKDEYRLMLSDVQANYPAKRSIFVDYSDINSLNQIGRAHV